jgi:hypothetical protein
MDYESFQSMTRKDALDYLTSFLKFGSERSIEILQANTHSLFEMDFSIESLEPMFRSLLDVLQTTPKSPDPSLPEFIRQSDTYKQNLYEFDESSKLRILASGYYLGESFVRGYSNLSWGIGNPNLHQCNMPVVRGFQSSLELPAILVSENICQSILCGMDDIESIDRTIATWKGFIQQ